MKNNSQKIKILFSIIFFAFFCFVFVYLYQKTNDNNKKSEEGTIAWQEEARKREDVASLDRSLDKIAEDRKMLETHFAKSSDVVPFLDMIESLGSQVGVRAEVESVGTNKDNSVLQVGVKAGGNFASLYKFLTLLENSSYELDFTSMDIHKAASLEAPLPVTKNSKAPVVASLPNWEADFKIELLSFTAK